SILRAERILIDEVGWIAEVDEGHERGVCLDRHVDGLHLATDYNLDRVSLSSSLRMTCRILHNGACYFESVARNATLELRCNVVTGCATRFLELERSVE